MMELSQPKLLGWTYCVTKLLVSWGEIVAVFVGVGRALVSLAVAAGVAGPSPPSGGRSQFLSPCRVPQGDFPFSPSSMGACFSAGG